MKLHTLQEHRATRYQGLVAIKRIPDSRHNSRKRSPLGKAHARRLGQLDEGVRRQYDVLAERAVHEAAEGAVVGRLVQRAVQQLGVDDAKHGVAHGEQSLRSRARLDDAPRHV